MANWACPDQPAVRSARNSYGARHTARGHAQPAFSPPAGQLVVRRAPSTGHEVACVINVSGETVVLPGVSGTDLTSMQLHAQLRLPPDGYARLHGAARRGRRER